MSGRWSTTGSPVCRLVLAFAVVGVTNTPSSAARHCVASLAARMSHLVAAQESVLEVHELQAEPDRWIGRTLMVAGRFQSASADRVRLVNSDIVFELPRASRRLKSGIRVVELRGQLERRGGQLHFVASSYVALPSEAEQFATRHAQLTEGNFEGLRELADWVERRATWYDDKDLSDLAIDAWREAILWEADHVARGRDADQLLALADQAAELGCDEREVRGLRFHALYLMREQLAEKDSGALDTLAQRVAKLLPGAETPPGSVSDALQRGFRIDPVSLYFKSDEVARELLDRLFWSDLIVRWLEARSREGDDPSRLARSAASLLPEHPELARRFELEAADRLAAEPRHLPRGKMLELREEFHRLEEPRRAERLAESWLSLQRGALARANINGRLRLAADYLELLDDESTAVELYLEVLELGPDHDAAQIALDQLGYELVAGQWQRPPAEGQRPVTVERRSVEVGDSENVARRRLPPPDRIARTLSAGAITEQWIYDGPPPFIVFLRREAGSAVGRVIATHNGSVKSAQR